MRAIRTDIQALRGLAVLMVVLYHARLPYFEAGYLGVDVFFVISGYLITSIIANGLDAGRFSLTGFYWRRARRILPAVYVALLGTVMLALWFLDGPVLQEFSSQVL